MRKYAISCKGGRTKQCFKDECNINIIIDKYLKKGKLPDLLKENPIFGDFTEPITYNNSMAIIEKAHAQFELLPSKVRDKFNTVEGFLSFVNNPENIKEMVELGLATYKPEKPPVMTPPASPATPEEKKA